ncbi:MAG: LD-carboxypeptidase [Bacteroidales bacterium]|nr:LD-carboxypeptidase [Bacteroidales bacterium]
MHIRIISPAGNIKGQLIDKGAATLKSWGHKVTIATHAKDKYGRFAATPEERAADIIEALEDPSVDILWCSRGGYGVVQMLDQIPLDLITKANKPIIGFSDVTALHALWNKAGVKSLHAPMMKHLADDPTHRTTKVLRELLDYYATHNHTWPPKHNGLFLKAGARNIIAEIEPQAVEFSETDASTLSFVGGNLSVLSGLHGTPFDYDYEGKVLFIEDIAEHAYKVDRMLQHLRLMGVLSQIKGLVCGHFTECDDDPTMPLRLWDNIRATVAPYGIPVLLGCPIGHELENYPVVIG